LRAFVLAPSEDDHSHKLHTGTSDPCLSWNHWNKDDRMPIIVLAASVIILLLLALS